MSSWSYDTNYLVEMINSKNMFDKMSIYVCTDVLPFFLNDILPKINNIFYLVTGDSDATVRNGLIDIYNNNPKKLDEETCLKIANHPKLIKWFIQNCIFTNNKNIINEQQVYNEMTNTKICQLPIGLDYHTISNDPGKFWKDENEGSLPKHQENILINIRKTMIPFYRRNPKIFVNMSIGNESCQRRQAVNKIPNQLLEINLNRMPRTKLWKELVKYTFALSPYGGGPDCHRHWEILSLGCIPIMKSIGSNQMFADLPVLIVNDWSDINEQLLEDTLEKFKNTVFDYNKLLLRYWVDQFSVNPLLEQSQISLQIS